MHGRGSCRRAGLQESATASLAGPASLVGGTWGSIPWSRENGPADSLATIASGGLDVGLVQAVEQCRRHVGRRAVAVAAAAGIELPAPGPLHQVMSPFGVHAAAGVAGAKAVAATTPGHDCSTDMNLCGREPAWGRDVEVSALKTGRPARGRPSGCGRRRPRVDSPGHKQSSKNGSFPPSQSDCKLII